MMIKYISFNLASKIHLFFNNQNASLKNTVLIPLSTVADYF